MSLANFELDPSTGVASLTVNRPDVLNAIDAALAEALRDAVREAAGTKPRLRCLILRGAGRAFVAGGDLSAFAQNFDHAGAVADRILDSMHEVVETLGRLDAPVIAQVHGAVAGAGLSLMMACDLVFAAQGTRFMMAYDRIGNSPDCGASWFLPRLMGTRRAAQFVLLSEMLDAEQALDAGLVNRVLAPEVLADEVERTARTIAAGPTSAYGRFKRLLQHSLDQPLSVQLEAERVAFREGTRTADFREGVSAFLQKRPARFTGT